MSQAVIFNSGRTPVKVSATGVTIGGHDWATVDTDTPEVIRGIERGVLIVTEDSTQSESTPAPAAEQPTTSSADSGS